MLRDLAPTPSEAAAGTRCRKDEPALTSSRSPAGRQCLAAAAGLGWYETLRPQKTLWRPPGGGPSRPVGCQGARPSELARARAGGRVRGGADFAPGGGRSQAVRQAGGWTLGGSTSPCHSDRRQSGRFDSGRTGTVRPALGPQGACRKFMRAIYLLLARASAGRVGITFARNPPRIFRAGRSGMPGIRTPVCKAVMHGGRAAGGPPAAPQAKRLNDLRLSKGVRNGQAEDSSPG